MTIDITQLALDEKRELVLRYAAGFGAAFVSMDEPELSVELAKYVRWKDSERRVVDSLSKVFGDKPRRLPTA